MGAFEPPHLILILVIVLIVFGPGKLPQLGKTLGEGIRELKRATNEDPQVTNAGAEQAPSAPVTPVSPQTRLCLQCQATVLITDRFCGACGVAQRTTSSSSAPSAVL